MTYGLDEPVSIPMVQMYDTDMMKMYIAAAKGEYERAYQEQKDFAKEFGELYSPSSTLNKAYYDATKGRVSAAMDYLYQNGIDPLRSQEGRAYIAKVIREVPYSDIAKWKTDAENMKTFQKAAATMVAEGKLTQDQLRYQMGELGLSYDKFDPYKQQWDTLAPTKMDSLQDLTKFQYDQLKPSMLTKDQVESEGYKYDPMNDYTGITYQSIEDAAGKSIPSVLQSAYGGYWYDRAKKQLQDQGVVNPTDEQTRKQLQDTVAQMYNSKHIFAYEPNKFALQKYSSDLDLNNALAKINAEVEADAKKTRNEYKIAKEYGYSKGGGKGSSSSNTIIDWADAYPGEKQTPDMHKSLTNQGVRFVDPNVSYKYSESNLTTHESETQKENPISRRASSTGQSNATTSSNATIKSSSHKITVNENTTAVAYGGFGKKQNKVISLSKGTRATVLDNITKNKDGQGYFALCEDDKTGRKFWLQVNRGIK